MKNLLRVFPYSGNYPLESMTLFIQFVRKIDLVLKKQLNIIPLSKRSKICFKDKNFNRKKDFKFFTLRERRLKLKIT